MNKEMFVILKRSIAAGVMISIGATVKTIYNNNIIGSLLFSIALFYICSFGMYLFTGRIGYVETIEQFVKTYIVWFGNFIGCIITMTLVGIALPNLRVDIFNIMNEKLCNNPLSVAILSMFCGVLMYLAVENYKNDNGLFGILISVVVFLTCGFEHSVANMAYATLYVHDIGSFASCFGFILYVSIFNSVGSLITRWMTKV